MVRENEWDRYEIALLIDAYIQIHINNLTKNKILSELSESLRSIAINKGNIISDEYRNLNGIKWQYNYIENAFENKHTNGHKPSNLFMQMTILYNFERDLFNKILKVARMEIDIYKAFSQFVFEDLLISPLEFDDYINI